MKTKTVLKMHMNCDKCRSKAMKIIASTEGVDSITIEGNDRDQFVVIGDRGVDSVKLVKDLRKNVCHTDIMSAGEVKKEEPKKEKEKETEGKFKIECSDYYRQWCQNPQLVVYDESYAPGSSCSIM